jgi:Ni,Fe-hydrogenase III large subunit
MGRFLVRRREALSSLELIERYLKFLRDEGTKPDDSAVPSTPRSIDDQAPTSNFGFGCVEGWRGATCYFVETNENGTIKKVKITDPSVNNWAALPIALHEAIVPDFPLVNKSFNQSYAGNDL